MAIIAYHHGLKVITFITQRQLQHWYKADKDLGKRIADGLGGVIYKNSHEKKIDSLRKIDDIFN